eukprot:g4060.t1
MITPKKRKSKKRTNKKKMTVSNERTRSHSESSSTSPRGKSRSRYETILYRFGSWSKRLALVSYVHKTLGDLPKHQAAILYTLGTFVSVSRVIFDSQSPHGSRRYIANLAGDDDAVRAIRGFQKPLPWDEVPDMFERKGSWFRKALRCGYHSMSRNKGTLIFFWTYTLVWRLIKARGRIGMKVLFPRGPLQFLRSMARTSALLFTFGFTFWSLLGLGHQIRLPSPGMTRFAAVCYVTTAAILALPMETRNRWNALAAFMLMSIVD